MNKIMWKLREKRVAERIRLKFTPDKRKVYEDKVEEIKINPYKGEMKTGPLKGIRVLSFNYQGSTESIAYRVDTKNHSITILYYGTHENFYKRLRNTLTSFQER